MRNISDTKALISDTGMGYKELADSIGVTLTALKNYASGRRPTPADVTAAILAQVPRKVTPVATPKGPDTSVATPATPATPELDGPEITEAYCRSLGYPIEDDDIEGLARKTRDIMDSRRLKLKLAKGAVPMGDVVTRCPTGDPAYDIMEDGYARGFPGDSKVMRANYRTPHALRRQAEAKGLEEKDIRKFIAKAGYPVLAMGTEVK